MAVPLMNPQEERNHATFTALMRALSHPGREQTLPDTGLAAFVAIGEALVDLETSYYTPHDALAATLARTGARFLSPTQARYQFYPHLHDQHLDYLRVAPAGDYVAPEDSATLVVGCVIGSGPAMELRGPGIRSAIEVRIDGLPAAFWSLRAGTLRYPLGWDVFLVAGDRVIGLPRTTRAEMIE